jgi:Short C-terminal domain
MVGGGAYMVGKHRAQSQHAEQEQEQSQDDRLSALEQQQAPPPEQAAPAAPAAPAAAAPAASGSIVDKLKELTDMKASGALSDAEFEQAKAQLLGGG